MQSQVSEIDPVTVELRVEVPWERVQKNLDELLTKLQRNARIKGFRPGKAPKSVVQKLYARDVRAEVVSTLVEQSLIEAVQQHELPVVSTARMESQPEITDGEPLAYKVKLEVRPKVAELETKLALKREMVSIADSAIDAELERIREQHAAERPLEGERGAKSGDVVVIDFAVEVDGQQTPEAAGEGRSVTLGAGRLLKEIEDGLLGANAGETREIVVERTEGPSELVGKKAIFTVSVKDVRERVLPEVDDELAKDAGDYETLDQLKASIRERLETGAKERSEGTLREQAVTEFVFSNPIPVPPSLLEQQLRSMLQEYQQFMQMIGQQGGLDQSLFDEMRQRAERNVRAAILLGELARRETVEVAPEEVEGRMREIAERTGKHIAKVKADYQGERREALESQLLEDKLIRLLLERATITDVEPGTLSEDGRTSPDGQDGTPDSGAQAPVSSDAGASSDQ